MRTVKLITWNPEEEYYEMSLGTLNATHISSYDVSCTDDLHVGGNLWVGDEFLTASIIRGLKEPKEYLALDTLRAHKVEILDKGDEKGRLEVSEIYLNDLYGATADFNSANIGYITCTKITFGDISLDKNVLSALLNSGSSGGGNSSAFETLTAQYAYVTNFVSAGNFRLSDTEYGGSLQIGTRDALFIQVDMEDPSILHLYSRGLFHSDDAEFQNATVRNLNAPVLTSDAATIGQLHATSFTADSFESASFSSNAITSGSVTAGEGHFGTIKLNDTSFDGENLKIGDDVVLRCFRNVEGNAVLNTPYIHVDMLSAVTLSSSTVEASVINAVSYVESFKMKTVQIQISATSDFQSDTTRELTYGYFNSLDASISEHDSRISSLESWVQSARPSIADLQTNISSLNTRVQTLQSSSSALRNDVDTLNMKLCGLRVSPEVAYSNGSPVYDLTLIVNNPPEGGGSSTSHSYKCITPENFDRQISLGDKLSQFMMPSNTSGYLRYPVGFMGLFVSYNPNTSGYGTGAVTNDVVQGDSPIRLYRFTMPLSSGGAVTDPKAVSVSIDTSSSVPDSWRLLTDCAPGWGLVFAIRVS